MAHMLAFPYLRDMCTHILIDGTDASISTSQRYVCVHVSLFMARMLAFPHLRDICTGIIYGMVGSIPMAQRYLCRYPCVWQGYWHSPHFRDTWTYILYHTDAATTMSQRYVYMYPYLWHRSEHPRISKICVHVSLFVVRVLAFPWLRSLFTCILIYGAEMPSIYCC